MYRNDGPDTYGAFIVRVDVSADGQLVEAFSAAQLAVLPEAAVFGFDIPAGPPGTVVEILGAGFADVSWVALGDTPASFTRTGAQLKFTVPLGATSGPVTVGTPTRTVTSGSIFIVKPPADPLEQWTWRGRLGDGFTGIAYGGGLFVAVGSFVDRAGIITSTDGLTWTAILILAIEGKRQG